MRNLKPEFIKNINLFGIIALAALIALSMVACGGGGSPSGGPQTVTYTGTSGGTAYTLVITENTARYAAQVGDTFELTIGGKTSTGTVTNVGSGGVLTLKPGNSSTTFTATVSGDGIASMTGTITFTDGSTSTAPSTMTPGAPSTFTLTGIPSQYVGKYAGFVFEGSSTSVVGGQSLTIAAGGATGTGTLVRITGTSVAIPGWTPDAAGTGAVQYTGSATLRGGVALFSQSTVALDFGHDDETFGTNPDVLVMFTDVAFTNGSATRAWSQGSVDTNPGGNTPGAASVTFSSVSANGSATQTTTALTLTFSAAIAGLSAADITLSGVSGVTKGTLSGAGPAYTLPISGFTAGGTLSVAVAKSGYTISGSPKSAAIYYAAPAGNGSFTVTGIPSEYNGKWAAVEAADDNVSLLGAQSVNASTRSITAVPISGGSAAIPMWLMNSSGTSVTRYGGNNTVGLIVYIINQPSFIEDDDVDPMIAAGWYSVAFSNGSATRTWASANEIETDFGSAVPSAPTGVTAARNQTTATTVNVTWNEVSGAERYKVYRSSTASGTGTQVADTKGNSASVSNCAVNETFYFRVIAENSREVQGAPSAWVSVGSASGGDFGYTETASAVTITGYFGTSKDVTIPATLNGKPVTIIDIEAFEYKQLTSVIIPDSVTTIKRDAFEQNQLTSVTLPSGLKTLDSGAFYNNKLTSITIPSSLTMISNNAFGKNQLTSVTIHSGVTIIAPGAFLDNPLTSVTIGNNVNLSTASYTSFPSNLDSVYINGGKKAGTYTRTSATATAWTKQ